MYKFKFNIAKEDIDNHIKSSLSEEQRAMLQGVKFVPLNVHCNEDMDIEITAVGVFEPEVESIENNENQE